MFFCAFFTGNKENISALSNEDAASLSADSNEGSSEEEEESASDEGEGPTMEGEESGEEEQKGPYVHPRGKKKGGINSEG